MVRLAFVYIEKNDNLWVRPVAEWKLPIPRYAEGIVFTAEDLWADNEPTASSVITVVHPCKVDCIVCVDIAKGVPADDIQQWLALRGFSELLDDKATADYFGIEEPPVEASTQPKEPTEADSEAAAALDAEAQRQAVEYEQSKAIPNLKIWLLHSPQVPLFGFWLSYGTCGLFLWNVEKTLERLRQAQPITLLRASCFVLRASCFVLRASCFVLRASC